MEDDKSRKAYIEDLVEKLRKAANKEECGSCGCFQGFLSKIEGKGACDISKQTGKLPPGKTQICLGCEPCPPGDVFEKYLGKKEAGEDR